MFTVSIVQMRIELAILTSCIQAVRYGVSEEHNSRFLRLTDFGSGGSINGFREINLLKPSGFFAYHRV